MEEAEVEVEPAVVVMVMVLCSQMGWMGGSFALCRIRVLVVGKSPTTINLIYIIAKYCIIVSGNENRPVPGRSATKSAVPFSYLSRSVSPVCETLYLPLNKNNQPTVVYSLSLPYTSRVGILYFTLLSSIASPIITRLTFTGSFYCRPVLEPASKQITESKWKVRSSVSRQSRPRLIQMLFEGTK